MTNVYTTTKDGVTPLYIAAKDGHTETCKVLLAAPGIDVNKETKVRVGGLLRGIVVYPTHGVVHNCP